MAHFTIPIEIAPKLFAVLGEILLTRSVSFEGGVAVVVGIDGPRGVAVDVAVQGVVAVAGHVDALGRVRGVVVDRFAVGPRGRGQVGEVAQRPEDAPRPARVDALGGPQVLRACIQESRVRAYAFRATLRPIYKKQHETN